MFTYSVYRNERDLLASGLPTELDGEAYLKVLEPSKDTYAIVRVWPNSRMESVWRGRIKKRGELQRSWYFPYAVLPFQPRQPS